ncbi:hypothetical protein [Mannheimia indoligenes]|uniref:hypothetical protein n=1 Tax=Mannheimia indoligenes TaxID=3103145 RepID=UPI002FE6C2E2
MTIYDSQKSVSIRHHKITLRVDTAEAKPNYRLCKKKNGEIVLQQMFIITQGYISHGNPYPASKVEWREIETVCEDGKVNL